jgi:hypothetical protein
MTLAHIAPLLPAKIFTQSSATDSEPVLHVVASDLMSDVLVANAEHFVLITSLASDQMIRTADLVGATGVILVNGKTPPESLTRLANDLDLPVLGTKLPKYETCVALSNILQQTQAR